MKRGWLACVLGCALVHAYGCSESSGRPSDGLDGGFYVTDDAGNPVLDDAGNPIPIDGGATDGGRPSTGSTALPCEVEAALDSICRDCHGTTPRFGAPMSLMTWEDVHEPAVTDEDTDVYELMGARINSESDPMPPPQWGELEPQHEAALEAWIAEGAPARDEGETCDGPADGGTSGDGGTDGGTLPGIGPDELPCEPDHQFVAGAEGGGEPYTVPHPGDDGNTYTCFAFDAPFAQGEQGTAWAPVVDNDRVLHHMILWESPNDYEDGSVFPCGALPDGDSKFLTGWAPGGRNFVMPDDVGLQLDPDSTLILQVHYFNPDEEVQPQADESGFAMCTGTGRSQEAGVIAVGPMDLNIDPRDETTHDLPCPGEITELLGGFTILASSPHMHQLGERFTTEIVREDGSVELLTEVDPWSFDDQMSYPQNPPVQVNEGDGITVTCTWDNPHNQAVHWGENTQQEMCFDFLLVYPVPDIQPVVDCANEILGGGFSYEGMLVCQEDVAGFAGLASQACTYCPELCD
ncbi:MAG: hypothetical protein ACODAU_02780 [Myxococcota bacterium]